MEEIFRDIHFDACIHLAAQASVTSSVKDPINDASVNILGSINIINLCKKYNCTKIIVASSAAVYGNPKYLPVDEEHPTKLVTDKAVANPKANNFLNFKIITSL